MTIAEVSKRFGLSADTLRYYERIGLIPPVPRNSSPRTMSGGEPSSIKRCLAVCRGEAVSEPA